MLSGHPRFEGNPGDLWIVSTRYCSFPPRIYNCVEDTFNPTLASITLQDETLCFIVCRTWARHPEGGPEARRMMFVCSNGSNGWIDGRVSCYDAVTSFELEHAADVR